MNTKKEIRYYGKVGNRVAIFNTNGTLLFYSRNKKELEFLKRHMGLIIYRKASPSFIKKHGYNYQ